MSRWIRNILAMLLMVGFFAGGSRRAFGRKAPTANAAKQTNDRIELIGHIAFDGKDVKGVITDEHWRRNYLYLTFVGTIKVVDVTDGPKPRITSEYTESSPLQAQLVVGNVAVLTDIAPATGNIPHAVSIVNFADPAKPEIIRQFANVTGFFVDSRRGLIYVINNEGLWILQEKPGHDLELEKQYEHDVLYNH